MMIKHYIRMRYYITCIAACTLLCATSPHFLDTHEVQEFKADTSLIFYIKSKYEISIAGIDCLFYPARHPKRLYIFCNGATAGKYTMWSWFWRDDEAWEDTAYLFLKDDDIRWYLGTAQKPLTDAYCTLITTIMKRCGLTPDQTFAVGHSMGGYAAIHFTLRLGLRAVFALRPQIDWASAAQYFSVKKLRDMWIDLDQLLLHSPHKPMVYLQYGEFGPDKDAGRIFLHALLEKNAFVILEKTANLSHTGYHPTKAYIETTLAYMEARGAYD
jgi:predicted esterase